MSEQSPEYGSCLAFLEPGEGLAWPVGESLGGEGKGECEGREGGGLTRQRRTLLTWSEHYSHHIITHRDTRRLEKLKLSMDEFITDTEY